LPVPRILLDLVTQKSPTCLVKRIIS
jgi:hypothetical protein